MVDTRFHATSGPMSLTALLAAVGHADDTIRDEAAAVLISGADELAHAGRNHVALAAHRNYAEDLKATSAGAVIVSEDLREGVPPDSIAIVSAHPHQLFAEILDCLFPAGTEALAGAPGAEAPALVEENVRLGSNVILGPGVEIGRNTIIGANTVIGKGVTIGRNCVIAGNCTIECSYLGDEVVLHAGVRIGCEGFGWLDLGRSNRKIPQLGRVILQDGVEVGANTTIDRGALGDTVVGEGSKIDNLVQIGHNCRIGRYCLIAAQSGLSGSTILEDGVLLGGGAGTSGHLTIGAGSIVYGRAAVTKNWPAGSKLVGAPARDIKDYWREAAMLRRLSKGEQR